MKRILTLFAALSFVGCASFVSKVTEGGANIKAVDIPQLPASEGKGISQNGYFKQDADGDQLPNGRPAYRYMTFVKRGNGLFRGNHARVYTNDGKLVALIEPRLNGWIFGNLTHPFGYFVDGATGAMWDPQVVPVP